MTDWNPDDPDATRVYYDLASWTFDQQAELAAAMADAEIPHGWVGAELAVPDELEQRADELISEVEQRLGIVSDGSDTLDESAPTTEYELDEWNESERLALSRALDEAHLAFRWAGSTIIVSTDDEVVVDALLDDIESGEHIDLGGASVAGDAASDGIDGGAAPAELLTTFFLAGERLRRDPLDPDGLEQLLAATDVADAAAPPFGVQPRLWAQTCVIADRVADALTDDGGPNLDEAREAAAELHDLLRPHV
ncbi:MAG: hypothetical protein FD127_42 [Acidimicrobiaceae bacterium]|jgi:hypothetical protein|nr:MAG: hypothetical protein FD127_42 [Acidimicrobiaceae bacterium]